MPTTRRCAAIYDKPLARIEDRLCPGVIGLPQDAAELMIDRIRWNAERFDVRLDDDPRLTPHHPYQGIPVDGYAAMMSRMLAGISVECEVDYLADRDAWPSRTMTIFTGPIDAYFDYSLGRLHYRGQRRSTRYLPDVQRYQPAAQVNEPLHAGGEHIRTLEWKQMMPPAAAAA